MTAPTVSDAPPSQAGTEAWSSLGWSLKRLAVSPATWGLGTLLRGPAVLRAAFCMVSSMTLKRPKRSSLASQLLLPNWRSFWKPSTGHTHAALIVSSRCSGRIVRKELVE